MPCACGAKKTNTSKTTYVYTAPGGQKTTYSTEVEAIAAVRRTGGTYKAQ
jgi:hypothetical protein